MDPIRFRCPKCRRLYSVASQDVQGERPEFQCITCQSEFWFQFPLPAGQTEAVTQFVDPLQSQQASANASSQTRSGVGVVKGGVSDSFPCPSCGFHNVKGQLDCQKCGIVFAKFNKREAGQASSANGAAMAPALGLQVTSASLAAAWEEVKQQYDNRELHEKFVQRCFSENNLPFASQQYRQILEANPEEEIAKAMRDRIITLTTLSYIPPERDRGGSGGKWGFSLILIIVGALLIITGLFSKELRVAAIVGLVLVAAGVGLKKMMAE